MLRVNSTFELHSYSTDLSPVSPGQAQEGNHLLPLDDLLTPENAENDGYSVLVLDQPGNEASASPTVDTACAEVGDAASVPAALPKPRNSSGLHGPDFVGIDRKTGFPMRIAQRKHAVAAVWSVSRRIGQSLVLIPYRDGLLVDGLPAPPLATLLSRASIVFTPGVHTYVTERIQPHIGKATPEMIGLRCPVCKLPIRKDDFVVSHRCGVVYHQVHESASHELGAENVSNKSCFEQVGLCLSCRRPMSLQSELVWDPREFFAR